MGLFGTKKEKLRPGCCAGTGGAERTGAPELVVDGKGVSCGRVLRKEEAKTLIARARM